MSNVYVPNVVGMQEADATETIVAYSLNPSVSYTGTGANSGNTGTVKSQSPSAGVSRPTGSTVSLTVYQYSAPTTTTVPNVVGLTTDVADATILSASLVPSGESSGTGATVSNDNTVSSQAYSPGTTRPINSTLPYTYYLYTNWLELTASVSSNDGNGLGYYPGVSYYFTAHNKTSSSVTLTYVIPGLLSSHSVTLGAGQNNAWFSNGYLSADYATTYTATISGPGKNGTETATASVTTPSAPTYPASWSDTSLSDTFRVGEAYSDSVSATGSDPITYTKTSGALPAGVTLSGGTVAGTPTTSGAYSFGITASNAYGSAGEITFSGTVAQPFGQLSYWNGTSWVQTPVRYWNGSSWTTGQVYVLLNGAWTRAY